MFSGFLLAIVWRALLKMHESYLRGLGWSNLTGRFCRNRTLFTVLDNEWEKNPQSYK